MNETSLSHRVSCKMRVCSIAAVTGTVFVLDQLTKYWVVVGMDMRSIAPVVVNKYLSLVMAWNTGVSFSMFAGGPKTMAYVLTALAVIVSGLLLRLAMNTARRWEMVGYAMVAGGALGNALDRVRFGAVADFIYVHVGDLGWPAFNVADSAICVGVGLLILCMLRPQARP